MTPDPPRSVMHKLSLGARLDEDPRMDTAARMTHGGRRNKIDEIKRLRDKLGVTNGKLAHSIGKSASVVSQVLDDKYPADPDPILLLLHQKLHDLAEVHRSGEPGSFVTTAVAYDIFVAVHTVIKLGTIGAIWGPAGVGKTLSLQAAARKRPDSIYLECMGHWTASALAEQLGRAVGVTMPTRHDVSRTTDKVIQRLTGSHRLLIFDEAHLLKRDPMTLVRQIHDATKCPVVLAGVPGLLDRLLAGRGDRMQGATLYSRVGLRCDLAERCVHKGEPLYTVEDVQAFFASLKLKLHKSDAPVRLAPQALAWLHQVACLAADGCDEGGMRVCKNAVLVAYEANCRERSFIGELTLEMLIEASGMIFGTAMARDIQDRVETRRAAAAG